MLDRVQSFDFPCIHCALLKYGARFNVVNSRFEKREQKHFEKQYVGLHSYCAVFAMLQLKKQIVKLKVHS